MKTTNYYNTFIQVAEDCPAATGEIPPEKTGGKTIANIQFSMLKSAPYKYSSDDVVFETYAQKNDLLLSEQDEARAAFFSKGQPCLRSSPLTKRYGWGIHHNPEGKIAIYGVDSDDYRRFAADPALQHVKAMRSKRT
ncbi:DUF6157 family protein [Pedobacter sp. SYP-B3415]|uniref:DUF6157 family protein n=1 Tax=Pedobacter sp. SYP-B3415 TaxID=2496641 RepID=UPI00101B8E04|nr:DUF6157 family protein [Pedobacter sp. SYP-B3415]